MPSDVPTEHTTIEPTPHSDLATNAAIPVAPSESDPTRITSSYEPDSSIRSSSQTQLSGRLGRYRIIQLLGQGGMGAVYLGHDEALDRLTALKVMHPQFAQDPVSCERFLREARAAAKAKSDHVVTIFEVGTDVGTPFIAMEYLEGKSLDRVLRDFSALSMTDMVRIGREAAEGLAVAHALGIVHRDVKPANLWIEEPKKRLKILDFGLARPVEPETALTSPGLTVGTPGYMSPEQARGKPVDARTDLFSLGAVLYRVVTNRVPFPGDSDIEILAKVVTEAPVPILQLNPAVPQPFAALIDRLLAKKPANRPQSAREVADILAAIELAIAKGDYAQTDSVASVGSHPESPPADSQELEPRTEVLKPPPLRRDRSRIRWMVLFAVLLVIVGFSVVVLNWPDPVSPSLATQPDVKPSRRPLTVPATSPTPVPTVPTKLTPLPQAMLLPIELLPMIDPMTDPIKSSWEPVERDLIARAPKVFGAVEFPYRPPAEYDYIAEFTCLERKRELSLMFSRERAIAQWTLGAQETKFGFAYVNGKADYLLLPDVNWDAKKRHVAQLEVRHTGVTGYLDDAKISEFPTDFKNLSRPPYTVFRDRTALGLGIVDGPIRFHRAAVIERTGTGTFTRTGPSVPDLKAAAWLSAIGGIVDLEDSGIWEKLHSAGPLPTGKWTIRTANLSRNSRFDDRDLARFADTNVSRILLDDTAVTVEGLRILMHATQLRHLYCRGTKLTDASLVVIPEFPSLIELDLGGAPVTNAGMEHLSRAERLSTISLWETKISDNGLIPLTRLPNLTDIHLAKTRLTDAALKHLLAMKQLKSVILDGTAITDAGLPQLYEMRQLTYLSLVGTQVTANGVKFLREKLPNCKISWPNN